jgi:hypothetical protein
VRVVFLVLVTALTASNYIQAKDRRCSAPPYGDTVERYEAYQPSEFKPAAFVVEACYAKFSHIGRQGFYAAGILDEEIEAQSTTELAERIRDFTFDKIFREHGKRITIADFMLDGKQLAANATPVIMRGAYILQGEADTLYADGQALLMAQSDVGAHSSVGLLTEDADRSFRKRLLSCQSDPAASQLGCPVTLRGFATICTRTNAFGTVRELPCIHVFDGH